MPLAPAPVRTPPLPAPDWTHPEAIALADAERAFFAEKRRIRSAKTRREYARVFAAFRAFCDRRAVPATVAAACTVEVLTAYADELESRPAGRARGAGPARAAELDHRLAPASVSGCLRPLNTLCRYLVRKGALAASPFAQTVDPLIPDVEDAPLRLARPADVAAILAAIPGDGPLALRDRALVVLDWDTGLRVEELARLPLPDLELDAAGATLRIRDPKNGRPWELRLTARVLPVLRAYLEAGRPALAAGHARHGTADLGYVFLADPRPHGGRAPLPGGQLTENGLYQLLTRRWRAAGGQGGFGWHRFRHGLGTEMGEHGASMAEIAARLNHKSLRSTARYVHPSAEHVAALVEGSAWAAVDAARAQGPGGVPDREPQAPDGASVVTGTGRVLLVLPGRAEAEPAPPAEPVATAR